MKESNDIVHFDLVEECIGWLPIFPPHPPNHRIKREIIRGDKMEVIGKKMKRVPKD